MLTGVVLNFVLVFTTLKIFGYSKDTIVTLLPRSITAAVGIEVLKNWEEQIQLLCSLS